MYRDPTLWRDVTIIVMMVMQVTALLATGIADLAVPEGAPPAGWQLIGCGLVMPIIGAASGLLRLCAEGVRP